MYISECVDDKSGQSKDLKATIKIFDDLNYYIYKVSLSVYKKKSLVLYILDKLSY